MLSRPYLRIYAALRAAGYQAFYAYADAKVLEQAESRGLSFTWEDEQERYEDVYGEPLPADCVGPFWVACQLDGESHPLDSIGMVTLRSNRDPYRHDVEADLAREALAVLNDRDQEQADALAMRATFAGVQL
jgi:hypothetical protein